MGSRNGLAQILSHACGADIRPNWVIRQRLMRIPFLPSSFNHMFECLIDWATCPVTIFCLLSRILI